jgi:Cu(I)/Ag(I) efflux system membrane protein CusA/SilA
MLWASGVGAEVIRPMAAPVLGGLLIADEVIDVILPVLYFAVQRPGSAGADACAKSSSQG